MNERIKELYDKAHLVREYPADDPWRGGNPPTIYWGGEQSAEKFAELIVEECAAYLNCAMEVHSQAEQDLCDHAARKIKEYFGVK